MNHKSFFFFFMMMSIVLLSGCWSQKELTELAIVTAFGFDKSEDGEYVGSFQIIIPGNIAGGQQGGGGTPITVYKATGNTLIEVSKKITTKLSRKQYFSHTGLIVIGEELAKEEGVMAVMDFLDRDPEFRTTASVVIAEDTTAASVIETLTPIDRMPANDVLKTIKYTEERWGEHLDVSVQSLINHLVAPGQEPLITGFRLAGNEEKAGKLENLQNTIPEPILQASGLGIIKDGKLIDWLHGERSKGVVWVLSKIGNTSIDINWKEKKSAIAYGVIRQNTDVSAQLKNNIPSISVRVHVEGNITETSVPIDLTDPHIFRKVEKKVEQKIKEQIEHSIEYVQKEKADVLGFGEVVHRSHPKAWKNLKHDWNDRYFPELQVDVTVDAFVRRTGLRNKSYLLEIEETR